MLRPLEVNSQRLRRVERARGKQEDVYLYLFILTVRENYPNETCKCARDCKVRELGHEE